MHFHVLFYNQPYHLFFHTGGVIEGQIRLDECGENVILDAIQILNSKQICLKALQPEREEDPSGENVESTSSVSNILMKARNKAVAEVSFTCYLIY